MVRILGFMAFALAGLVGIGEVSAQTPPASRPANPRPVFDEALIKLRNTNLVQRYVPLFADIYSMNPAQKQALNTLIENMAKADLEYFRANDKEMTQALADIRAISKQMTQPGSKDPAERERLVKQQDAAMKTYRDFQLGSPLNIDKIAAAIEKTLPKAQADKGHETYLQRKPYGLRPPPSQNPAQQIPHPMTPPVPTDPKLASPTQFRAATLAAPPVERWAGIVEAVITQYGYNDVQKAKARAIYHDIDARVGAYLKKNAVAISLAEKTSSSAERDQKLSELYRDVDLGYDELRQRIEQLAKAGQAEATTALDFAPPVARWSVAVERMITARNYNEQQAGEARKDLAESLKRGDQFMTAHGSELTANGASADPMHGPYAPLDKVFQELKTQVEKLGPAPAEKPIQPAAGGH